jgi:hypothetical protein
MANVLRLLIIAALISGCASPLVEAPTAFMPPIAENLTTITWSIGECYHCAEFIPKLEKLAAERPAVDVILIASKYDEMPDIEGVTVYKGNGVMPVFAAGWPHTAIYVNGEPEIRKNLAGNVEYSVLIAMVDYFANNE